MLIKRGFGITLDESLNAAEYLATEGNRKVVFCLRGMKTNMGDPHRNFVDFSHVPVVKRLTRMPVAIDPSHSVGTRARAPDGLLDIFHVVAQGVIAGANMVLVDFHPDPRERARRRTAGAAAVRAAPVPRRRRDRPRRLRQADEARARARRGHLIAGMRSRTSQGHPSHRHDAANDHGDASDCVSRAALARRRARADDLALPAAAAGRRAPPRARSRRPTATSGISTGWTPTTAPQTRRSSCCSTASKAARIRITRARCCWRARAQRLARRRPAFSRLQRRAEPAAARLSFG